MNFEKRDAWNRVMENCLTGKRSKNVGQQTQYYVANNRKQLLSGRDLRKFSVERVQRDKGQRSR
jgi:hypothetical protein